MDALGAQESVLEVARNLGLSVSVAVAHEIFSNKSGIFATIKMNHVN